MKYMKKMIAVAMIATFAVACTNGTTNTTPVTTDSTSTVDSTVVTNDTTAVVDTTTPDVKVK
jgi:PBP1b-binding outer membrane lipoprotein LpoB